jgi:hypothetical protein
MRRVLVIAYYFPPFGGAGVQRTLKFVKYLPEFGWQPVVLTVKEQVAHLRDPSLEEDIPSRTPIHRTLAVLPPPWLPWRLRNFVSRWLRAIGLATLCCDQGEAISSPRRRSGDLYDLDALYESSHWLFAKAADEAPVGS